MERQVVVTKRFRNQTQRTYQYIIKKFSAPTAYSFLEKLEERVQLISKHPAIGRIVKNYDSIRYIQLIPHNLIFYRVKKNKIEILSLFDTRRSPKRKPFK